MFNSNSGYSLADIAAASGNNRNNGGFGGFEGEGMWILFFIIVIMGGGWNNGFGGGYSNGGGTAYVANDVQRGFDQAAVTTGINGISTSLCNGFANVQQSLCGGFAGVNGAIANGFAQAEIAANARQMADMQQNFGIQSALQQCCCDNRAATADLKYTVATEACADRQAVTNALFDVTAQGNANTNALMMAINNGFQGIKDQMCQDKMDAKDTEIANLRTQLNMQNLAASQTAQTAQLIADNAAQTQYVVNRVAPYPQPAIVYGYNNSWMSNGNCGCSGCGGNGFYN